MKKIYSAITFSFFLLLSLVSPAQISPSSQWTWIKGDNTTNQSGVYGVLLTPDPANKPGARQGGITWTDAAGNFWLFGGNGYAATGFGNGFLNDLWKYNPSTNQWTWVSGDFSANQSGIYGVQGTPSAANKPGARYLGTSWIDGSGNFWLFGGNGYDGSSNLGDLNDLWRFNPTTNEWTWVKGDNTVNQTGTYGLLGTPASSNKPGARQQVVGWRDAAGNFWLFGGNGYDASTGVGYLNDLWKFDPVTTLQWTWVKGDNTLDQAGVYGVLGTPASPNKPGARQGGLTWKDGSNNLWLFGGLGYEGTGTFGYLNDLWRYDITTNQWTWIKGDNAVNQAGVYGTLGTASPTNKPGARYLSVAWTDPSGNFWLLGGNGYDASSNQGFLNDLWRYTPNGNWTWIKGANVINQTSTYGTQGTAAAANKPGARQASHSWLDASGNFWLLGGFGYDASAAGYLNDLWKLGAGSVLPVTLFNVKAYQKNTGVQIEWATQQENNIDRYDVEVSTNGQQFTKFGSEQSKGNNSGITNYNLLDPAPAGGVNFYRIKIIDKSGQVTYSQIIRINISGNVKNIVNIYPNPIVGKRITLQIDLQKGSYTVSLTNNLGEQIMTKAINHPGGSAIENIELPQVLAAGVYQLMVTGEGAKITNLVIKN